MSFYRHKPSSQQQEYLQQREEKFKQYEEKKKKKKRKIKLVILIVAALLVLSIGGYSTYYFLTPGAYDAFAQCLTEKGAVMYGAIQWCQYTRAQANMFGKSFKYINYHDEKELPGIKTRPTWVIDGKWYEKVQSFQTLAAATGCEI